MTETRPAATVLLLRDGGAGLEVFMGRRHPLTGFAGDALVFPGGRIDDADRAFARRGVCVRVAGEDETATAFRVGALRETFEESGVLLARKNGRPAGAACAPARGGRAFAEFLEGEGLVLATDLLVPFAHWITPEGLFPKRFDTMFFLAAAPAGQVAAHDGEELVDSCWIAPARALAGEGGGRLEFVTRRNLEKLGRARTVVEALETARARRIVTVLPAIEDTPEGPRARLPVEAGYGGPLFDFSR